MAVTMDSEPAESRPERPGAPSSPCAAAATAGRVWSAGFALGGLGLGLSLFVVSRLLLTWRVTPHAAAHEISILGQRLSYPAANLDAIVILVLAAVGLVTVAMTVLGAVRELAADRLFRRRLELTEPRPLNGAWVLDDERPHAFCAGLFHPRVYVSSGAVGLLDASALDAVLAHEAHHARCHDPLRLAAGRVLGRALFFVPGLRELVRRQQALAELGADESAINAAAEHRSALARAMLTFAEASGPANPVGIDPARVDHLLGEAPRWRFPTLLCCAAAGVIALLAAIAVLAGHLAVGSATLAPPFFSRQPCVLALALIPAVGLMGAYLGRAVARARRRPAQSV
jgi:beta-lactamase regulating signal transducer with metallopeptidase domain